MTEFVDELLLNLRLADLADILVVSVLFYLGLHWLRRRTARAVAFALFFLALLYVCANAFDMYLTRNLFGAGLTVLLVSLVIIFQQDIRRTFEQMSSWRGFHSPKPPEDWSATVDQLVETTSTLARQRMGGLIVLEGTQPLEPHIEGGVTIKGKISLPLLLSIFHPDTPGHDGAVVIDRDRVEMLGAYLPLSRNLEKIGKGGTRHAAALGLSEDCDSLVVVVSEERGTISVAENGELTQLDSVAALKNRLESYYERKYPVRRDLGLTRAWRRHLTLKGLAVAMACLLWFIVAFRVETIQRTEEVPIEFRNLPKNLVIDDPEPSKTKVTLMGKERDLKAFDAKNLKVSIDLQGIGEGEHEVQLNGSHLNLPSTLAVRHFENVSVKFHVYNFRDKTAELPIEPVFDNKLAETHRITVLEVVPKKVTVLLRDVGQTPPAKLETHPILVSEPKPTPTVTVQLKLPANVEFFGGKHPDVKVTFQISKKKDATKISAMN